MKRVLAALFGTVAGLVMLLNFKTQSTSIASIPAATSTTGDTGSSGTGGGTTATPRTTTTPSTNQSSGASTGSRTYTGDSIDTQWGPVQVQITVSNGKITKAAAVVYPMNNGQDQQINSYAIPALQQETVAAQSGQIDMISGATYTSTGYIQSLQSALNKAGL